LSGHLDDHGRDRQVEDLFVALAEAAHAPATEVRQGDRGIEAIMPDKSNVEGLVSYARRNFMVPISQFATWGAFNAFLEEQCRKRKRDRLRDESETVGERLQRDLASMRPPTASLFDTFEQVSVKATAQLLCPLKTGLFAVGVFRGIFPAGRRSGSDEGIEVFGRPEGVYSEAGG